jgi:ADP-ribosylglycohydrolase
MTNTTNLNIPSEKAQGSIWGLAFGDAIGDPVEFRKYDQIVAAGGAKVPARLRITDDTQMSLAVWNAINTWNIETSLGHLRMDMLTEFVAWKHDKDNTRAPGATCMSAIGSLERVGLGRWVSATSAHSAGCGSVMRAPWIGVHPKVADEMVGPIAMLQAVLTHGPAENAFCAAALAELTRAIARDEVVPGQAADWLFEWAAQSHSYDQAALGDVWKVAKHSDAQTMGHRDQGDYVREGVAHVSWVADAAADLAAELRQPQGFWAIDPCSIAGEGWRARECMAVAVGIFDAITPNEDGVDALLRAAQTNGDSDSIGAITGGLVGAHFGYSEFPAEWLDRLETRYCRELFALDKQVELEV